MKLLYITQMYPSKELPQYCVFLHCQVKALIENGVEIVVAVPSTERETSEVVYDGVRVVYLHFKDYSRSVMYPLVTGALRNELKKMVDLSDFDAVYAIHAQANILDFSRVVAKKMKKPLIVHYRGYNIFEEYEPEKEPLFSHPKKVKERVVKASALSIGVSQKTVDIIKKRFDDAPVAVVFNGIDTKEFFPAEEEKTDERVKILCVANLIPIKGHRFLFSAVKEIKEKHPDIKLAVNVVGRGVIENELKALAKKQQLDEVVFHGYVVHEEIARMMQKTDIFALPSVYESFGNVNLEAMACRKPVILFEGQGIDEILEDGVSAMIARYADQADFTKKLETLVLDETVRARIAENGFKIAQQMSWDRSAKDILAALKNVVNA